MENLSTRTTAIIALCLLLLSVGWGLGWQMVAEGSYPPVRCDFHYQHVTCAPVGKAA